ncbi:unnamed protein product, partial [Effrenium voratum]
VFVYGTLKRGFTNHVRYLGLAEKCRKAVYAGRAKTRLRFPMVLRPPHVEPTTVAPVLMDKEGAGHHIHGEVYRVDGSHVPQEPRASLTKHMTQLDFFFWWRHSGSIGYLGMCFERLLL